MPSTCSATSAKCTPRRRSLVSRTTRSLLARPARAMARRSGGRHQAQLTSQSHTAPSSVGRVRQSSRAPACTAQADCQRSKREAKGSSRSLRLARPSRQCFRMRESAFWRRGAASHIAAFICSQPAQRAACRRQEQPPRSSFEAAQGSASRSRRVWGRPGGDHQRPSLIQGGLLRE